MTGVLLPRLWDRLFAGLPTRAYRASIERAAKLKFSELVVQGHYLEPWAGCRSHGIILRSLKHCTTAQSCALGGFRPAYSTS